MRNDQIDQKASQIIKESLAKMDKSSGDFYWACAQHPGGICESGYKNLDDAQAALDKHKEKTGHTNCSASSGKCPF